MGYCCVNGFFLPVMVGGGRGVAGTKELMEWVGTVTDGRAYSPPAPRSTEVEKYFLRHVS
jgi:hypothetical protein